MPARTDFFGDDIAEKLSEEGRPRAIRGLGDSTDEQPKPDLAGYEHALLFQDGRHLRGELVAIGGKEIIWRRPDCHEPLRFPREQIRRVLFSPADQTSPVVVPVEEEHGRSGSSSDRGKATLKLPGADWLHGKLTSPDGERFKLELERGAVLEMTRSHLEWIYFAATPVPAFGCSGNALEIEGWLPPGGRARVEISHGTVTIADVQGLLRPVAAPRRFEVTLDLPEKGEEGARLWLQPFGPIWNCYSTGTIELQFGPTQLSRLLYINKFERQATPIVRDDGEKGPVRYRVFYDGVGERLTVLRNGRQVGSWGFRDGQEKPFAQGDFTRTRPVTGICLDRQGKELELNGLRVLPWDGVVPRDDVPATDDRLAIGKEPSVSGKLESINEKELVFGGKTQRRDERMLLRFPSTSQPLPDPDAMLIFGESGEVAVSGLQIEAGKARCRTAFSGALELPLRSLRTIAFPTRSQTEKARADLLVFRNCDELPGSLVAAAESGWLRWKTLSGQEIALESERVAGIAFAPTDVVPRPPGGTLELRNGDRLRGDFVGLDADRVQWLHSQFGPLTFGRPSVQNLFPFGGRAVWDGGQGPVAADATKSTRRLGEQKVLTIPNVIQLDGHYIFRGLGNTSGGQSTPGIAVELPPELDRFEIRADATQTGGGEPSFNVELSARERTASLRASCSQNELQLVVQNGLRAQGPNWREIPARDKLPAPSSRLNVRIFVDRRQGVAQFYFDGVFIGKTGLQASERLPGLGSRVEFSSDQQQDAPLVLSSLWIGPWSGELPASTGARPPRTCLANGDVIEAAPDDLREGIFNVQAEVGSLQIPLEKVQIVEFAEVLTGPSTPARIRLSDGSVLGVETFHWRDAELVAESRELGAIRLPAGMVRELLYRPSPARALRVPPTKETAQNVEAGQPAGEDEPKQ